MGEGGVKINGGLEFRKKIVNIGNEKSHVILLKENVKLKEKYYINKKTDLATEENFVLHHSLKINKWGS